MGIAFHVADDYDLGNSDGNNFSTLYLNYFLYIYIYKLFYIIFNSVYIEAFQMC